MSRSASSGARHDPRMRVCLRSERILSRHLCRLARESDLTRLRGGGRGVIVAPLTFPVHPRSGISPPDGWKAATMNSRERNRKYGRAHRLLRRQLDLMIRRGLRPACSRCGLPIQPNDLWDLGHVDGSLVEYRGPEHRRCNRATASHRSDRAKVPPDDPGRGIFYSSTGIRTSRKW
jgi:hypothetical protein